MEEVLKLISGTCWSTVYIALIYNGFKHKSYGMPLAALGLNLAWEAIYSFYKFDLDTIGLQQGINLLWFTLDLVILYQYFAFGKKYFTKKVSSTFFIPWSILVLLICAIIEFGFFFEFGYKSGAKYSAFLQNLLMSFLFIDLLLKRTKVAELSMTVAVCKWVGTLAPTILFGMNNNFILTIGILCTVIDIIYIILLYQAKQKVKLATQI